MTANTNSLPLRVMERAERFHDREAGDDSYDPNRRKPDSFYECDPYGGDYEEEEEA